MRWDDFARVGAPEISGPAARGLAIGRSTFPPQLHEGMTKAGLHVEEVPESTDLGALVAAWRPDLLILAAATGADPLALAAQLRAARPGGTCPLILLTTERVLPEAAPAGTPFAEHLGTGQDALGYFLLLRATLRRQRPQAVTDRLAVGAMVLDQETFRLHWCGRSAPLSKLEFCILGAMCDAPRMVWSKVFLNRVVFGPVEVKPGRQFDTYMSRVRRGIRDRLGIDPIVAEHRRGYALSPALLGPVDPTGRPG